MYRKLVASRLVPASAEELADVLQQPFCADTVVKNEPRTLIRRILLPDGTAAIVKTYRRRSLYDFSRESRTRFRAQREFDALGYLAEKAVPCSIPVCWGYGRDAQSGRFESLVTLEEPGVVGLKDYLRSARADQRWVQPVAALVRRAHDVGFYHGALAPRNILFRAGDDSGRCIMIDTPKSIVFRRPVTGTRMADHDLLVFLCEVNNVVGDAAVAGFLARYGMQAADIGPMVERVRNYRAGRNTRNRMRAEFLLRKVLD